MNKKVLVTIADGIEEIEAVCIIDVLRRAGSDVTVAAVGDSLQITASRGVVLVADRLIKQCKDISYDLIALPGGMPGAENLRDCTILINMLKKQKTSGRYYAAICASPAVVFAACGLLEGCNATCYPSFIKKLPNHIDEKVVVDNNCITSQGPGTALLFSLKLVEILYGAEKAKGIADAMIAATI
ncbi:MAG TPA: DJ-1/PfpI family protein [Sedimentisphaerales bacterium]|nr:DJ-1/PfpI family protein [Sedimentisphaerales bacterium]